jgi:hypothetical protein
MSKLLKLFHERTLSYLVLTHFWNVFFKPGGNCTFFVTNTSHRHVYRSLFKSSHLVFSLEILLIHLFNIFRRSTQGMNTTFMVRVEPFRTDKSIGLVVGYFSRFMRHSCSFFRQQGLFLQCGAMDQKTTDRRTLFRL